MKKYLVIIGAAASLFACNTHEKELTFATHQRDSLNNIINERDSSLNDFVNSYNDIANNLSEINKKQNVISVNVDKTKGELKENTKDRINSEIKAINELMEKNKKQISELNRKLKSSNSKSAEYDKMIKMLNDQIVQKENDLSVLNSKLTALNTQVAQLQTNVDTLNVVSTNQTQTISDQTMAMHTAYYVIGDTKQLQASNVIDRTGGLLGIGKTPRLSNKADNSKFTRIDYTQTMSIPVNSKGKIITTHPADSYTLEKDIKNKNKIVDVRITNPEKFWSASKYLVVVKD
jgi:gas vesicle protein